MGKGVIIWAEGGSTMGMGHVNRGLVIAQKLQKESVETLFCVNPDRAVAKRLEESGFEYVIAAVDSEGLEVILRQKDGVVVLDTKKPVGLLVRRLKKHGKKVIVMDNQAESLMEADLKIFPTAFYRPECRAAGAPVTIGGEQYIPIGESFKRLRSPVKKDLGPPYRILVTMGGSDPNRLTFRVLSAFTDIGEDAQITALIGPAFAQDERLDEIERRASQRIRFVRHVSDLAPLMVESHLVITAVGTTIYEAAYLGVPVIVLGNYRSDATDIDSINRLGFGVGLGFYEDVTEGDIRHALERLVADRTLYEAISHKGKALVDGLGASRIAEIIVSLQPVGD